MLVVLVVRDGAAWLKGCLASLGRQTHPRLGVVAVDNASSDGSGEILASALGPQRVLRAESNLGFNRAVGRALARPLAEKADYVLVLHDDTVLAPDTVSRLVDAASRVDRPGVVGPKILDAERPRVLREVGLASDRFAYPYSSLEEDEIDQGQYDTPREVLYVSSAAMLVSREAWQQAGAFDERLDGCHGDLDFCWRVRLAGFRVLVDPRAVVLHRSAAETGARPGSQPERARYLRERAGLLSILKNYRRRSLLWVLPLYFVQGLARVAALLISRRFASAGQVLSAWAWNVRHLGGTLKSRRRARTVRRVPDRAVARYMAPAGARLRRWFLQASSVLVGAETGPLEPDVEGPRLRSRVAGLLGAHPVALGWMVAIVLSLVAFREVLFSPELQGGALPRLPSDASGLFQEFGSGWRSAGFGGPGGASPALVPLGVGSLLALNDPGLLLRLIVSGGLVLAAVFAYRALIVLVEDRSSAVAGAACYALSAVVMWAVSEGRIGVIVFLAALPWLANRTLQAFARRPAHLPAWVAGTAAGLALATSFFPSAWLAVAVLTVSAALFTPAGGSRWRGMGLMAATAAAAAVLVFPFTVTLVDAGGAATVDGAGRADVLAMLRLAPGPAPGAWAAAAFLPVAGVLAFAMSDDRRGAWREALGAGACLLLAWLAAARWLPAPVANPVAFLGTAAFLLGALVASALSTLTAQVHQRAFGHRQLAVAALGTVVAVGLILQAGQALVGGWGVGRNRIAPAWALVATADPGATFRVLWLGGPGGDAFPPPGGSPDGQVAVGTTSARYGITDRQGRSVSALGLPPGGPAFARLEEVLRGVLSGRLRHGGSLLSTMGVQYVVAGDDDLPAHAVRALAGQVDLDLIQHAGGLRLYQSAVSLPVAWAAPGRGAVRASDPSEVARALGSGALAAAEPLRRTAPGSWVGRVRLSRPGTVVLGTQFDPRWRLGGLSVKPYPALGWATGFDLPPGPRTVVAGFGGQAARSAEVAGMAVLWLAVLWLTRRGPRRGEGGR